MTNSPTQLNLPLLPTDSSPSSTHYKKRTNGQLNRLDDEDRAVHDWYRFVLSYPPHLVRDYISRFGLTPGQTVLDPFCGTGTTLVEAKLAGIRASGIEANPFAHFASSVKINWKVNPEDLHQYSRQIAEQTLSNLASQGIDDFSPLHVCPQESCLKGLSSEATELLITNSISPVPLHKTLILLEVIDQYANTACYHHLRLALANALVFRISNLHFGPEVGVGKIKTDAPVVALWLAEIDKMVQDLKWTFQRLVGEANVYLADSRNVSEILQPQSIDAVITSPPYPNEKDYTRTTRLESVILGFVQNKSALRQLKKNLIRSNTRSVYKEDQDDQWVAGIPEIQRIAIQIEQRRLELGKTSGFEKLYSRVTKLYFGGMSRHLNDLKAVLKPGARLAYVVGDQASYLRIMIRTGELLADIAKQLGYQVESIDLFRTRFATASQEQLREEVVVLHWPG